MTDSGLNSVPQPPIEATLADRLARGDVVLGAAGPMLGMLVLNHDSAFFSDEVVARVRGMCGHVAQQMVAAYRAEAEDAGADIAGQNARLAEALSGDMEFLRHCHALALEHRFALQLERAYAISPAASPMLEELIASSDAAVARLATAVIAAQARFEQQQRRSELPVAELPPQLFERVLSLGREHGADAENDADRVNRRLRDNYDPQGNRIALLLQVIAAAGGELMKGLSLRRAGSALFLSALAFASGQDRDVVALTTSESQAARLTLALCAAGLTPAQVAEEFALIHSGVPVPDAADMPSADRAAVILGASRQRTMD